MAGERTSSACLKEEKFWHSREHRSVVSVESSHKLLDIYRLAVCSGQRITVSVCEHDHNAAVTETMAIIIREFLCYRQHFLQQAE